MSHIIDELIANIQNGKYKKAYNIFLIIFISVFTVRTAIILSSPKPYLLVKNVNVNNVLEEQIDSAEEEISKPVKFKDDNFEYKIRSILGVFDRDILDKDLKKITSMDLNHNNIEDLEGIQYCVNLKKINLSYNKISNIDNLRNLKKLEEINLFNNNIEDISALSNLSKLKKIDLAKNRIKDVTPLGSLKNLQELDLYSNHIENIEVLSQLKKLTFLDVSRNKIKDLNPIKGMNLKSKELLYWGNDN
ncbi:leucine-rich repeat domain-containing protein [Clostridium sp.]|jgi:Leucine-rich repeat (LRR) protein|uniref:leucine-rich repeat domain-containing protein n=1 Tax=Clostridium sp. TaxID=1506 RepID=UPI0039F54FF5